VWVKVGVKVIVWVGLWVGVMVWVDVGEWVGVVVAAATLCCGPVKVPPETRAAWEVPKPMATTPDALNRFANDLLAIPGTRRSNTNINVWGTPLAKVTNPLRLVNVTAPEASKERLPCAKGWLTPV
jgi:hypothetical protein